MEGLEKAFRKVTNYSNAGPQSSENPFSSGKGGVASAVLSSDDSRILVTRPPRQVVSLLTCSKLCAVFFVAGVVVGYTLKRRVRRWASRLLRRLKDD